MGIGICKVSKSSYDSIKERNNITIQIVKDTPKPTVDRNPNPLHYLIIDHIHVGNSLVLKLQYWDATNYEGVKILVYRNTKLVDLLKQKSIDPHFSQSKKFKSPFARFEPTKEGWKMARDFAARLK